MKLGLISPTHGPNSGSLGVSLSPCASGPRYRLIILLPPPLCSLTHHQSSLTHSLTHSHDHHSLTHSSSSLTHSLPLFIIIIIMTHSLTHSFTHSHCSSSSFIITHSLTRSLPRRALLKPSEYQGLKGTAVAGRVVILATQEVKTKVPKSKAKSKTEHAGRKGSQPQASTKLELHLAGADSVNEVVFIEAWADQPTQFGLRCKVGDLISITGLAHSLTRLLPHSLTRIHLYTLCQRIEYTCGVIRSFNLYTLVRTLT